jgi:hypothetical protein
VESSDPGSTGKLLSVRCDASKPLQANIENFTGDEGDPGIWRARRFHKPQRLGWKLEEPVAFVDSRDHPAIQLADVIASATVTIVKNDYPEEYRAVAEVLSPHVHKHSIMPDMDVVDPSTRNALVNSVILFDLAKRAERQADPYRGLPVMYHMAEESFARGDFHRIMAR